MGKTFFFKKKGKWRRWPWSIQMKLSWSKKWITTIGHIICAVIQIKPRLSHIELKLDKKDVKMGWRRETLGRLPETLIIHVDSNMRKSKNRFLYIEMKLEAQTRKKQNQNKTKGHSQKLLNNVKLLPIALQTFFQLICSWYKGWTHSFNILPLGYT